MQTMNSAGWWHGWDCVMRECNKREYNWTTLDHSVATWFGSISRDKLKTEFAQEMIRGIRAAQEHIINCMSIALPSNLKSW